ncbi:hypothetical protein DJ021_02735 [Phenylobacterium hankyongense]|uniref:Uncharacterized protein n=1 Tax=Phenylobacterium hankyongense TaxID=1813876 RepID=A0A328AUU4_9CAUL|nr:putative 2OG-Fe(II) oxygenase [Phenylobacterium hankyongense]RAK58793.1 hypothetical protein DJ021_02735 [Phenylobacterium hankyongense]
MNTDSTDVRTRVSQAETLLEQGRPAEALVLTKPLADAADAGHPALATHATVLKALGRTEEALAYNLTASRRFARSGVAWHNLAATLGDLGRGAESRSAAERAFSLGLDAPQTWSLYARSLLAVGALDEAERAYRESVGREAGGEVVIELANVVWMRRGDLAEALTVLDDGFRAGGPASPLVRAKARLMEAAGDAAQGAHLLAMAAERLPTDIPVLLAAAQAALETGAGVRARAIADAAVALAPDSPEALNQLAIVQLGLGQPDQALATARRGLALSPDHQSLIGWAATAARALGDPLYGELYDYERMVGVYEIATPAGWPSLAAYLSELAEVLRRMHPYAQHPFHQSLRHGSQTMQAIAGSTEPAVRAFFQAIDAPIRQHMAWLGQGGDPHRRRRTDDYRIAAAWSVLLRPGGFHKDHFHPQGWISSAFYVETPEQALATDERQGWIRFGRPPLTLNPPLEAAHHVRPKPGRLVLFPSYMWHGTEPFTTDERRMTIAFDVVPA